MRTLERPAWWRHGPATYTRCECGAVVRLDTDSIVGRASQAMVSGRCACGLALELLLVGWPGPQYRTETCPDCRGRKVRLGETCEACGGAGRIGVVAMEAA